MMKTLLAEQGNDLNAKLLAEGTEMTVQLEGRAETPARELLGRFLRAADTLLTSGKAKSVSVDFHRLQFMNSSCFKEMVVWLSDIKKRPPAQQYRLRFLSNSRYRWQKASLYSLSCFAIDLVEIVSA